MTINCTLAPIQNSVVGNTSYKSCYLGQNGWHNYVLPRGLVHGVELFGGFLRSAPAQGLVQIQIDPLS